MHGCCRFSPRWHSWAFWSHQDHIIEIRLNFNYSILTLIMHVWEIFAQRVVQIGSKYSYWFSWRDCDGLLFVVYSITHLFHVLGGFCFYFVPFCTFYIWHGICCVISSFVDISMSVKFFFRQYYVMYPLVTNKISSINNSEFNRIKIYIFSAIIQWKICQFKRNGISTHILLA